MRCEFEEKQYEILLTTELAHQGRIFPSGQVLESTIGIDSAVFTTHRHFWKNWHQIKFPAVLHRYWDDGVNIDSSLWDDVEDKLNSVDFPIFKCNVFIQYKRPEYISSPRGKEYGFWNQSYYRYNIEKNQLDILSRLEQKIKRNALVIYASPAFWKYHELFNYQKRKSIINNSNFVKPHNLIGHTRYSYSEEGTEGKAFSEPKKIEPIDFWDEIIRILENPLEFNKNSDFIHYLSNIIIKIMDETESEYNIIFDTIKEYLDFYNHRFAKSMMSIILFSQFTNILWSIKFEWEPDSNDNNRIGSLIDIYDDPYTYDNLIERPLISIQR